MQGRGIKKLKLYIQSDEMPTMIKKPVKFLPKWLTDNGTYFRLLQQVEQSLRGIMVYCPDLYGHC